MKAYTYINTKTEIPHWEKTTHQTLKYGYGYETNTHFVHFYGQESFYIISVGLTVIEAKNCSYAEWLEKRFGAIEIQEMNSKVGEAVEAIWRPSLYYWEDIQKCLNVDPNEQRSQEQALRILVEKLDEILLFVEPSSDGLKAYSHKIRELLILGCTEVENQWRALLNRASHLPLKGKEFTTQDYVKILPASYIDEYQVSLKNYHNFTPSKPFYAWDAAQPTKSIVWYNSYNQTKHDRDKHFSSATLSHAIDAVAANIILYCTRFSPLILINDTNTLSGLIKQIFEIKMIDANRRSFYIPELVFPNDIRTDCFVYDSHQAGHHQNWNTKEFRL